MSYSTVPIKIDSSQRINYATTNAGQFRVPLQQAMQGTYALKQVLVPITNFNVSATDNVIPFFENGVAKTAALSIGYYTSATLKTAVVNALNTASGGFAIYTADVSSIPQRLTISSTQPFQLQFGTRSTNSIALTLGYLPADTDLATFQLAPNGINLSVIRSYNVSVNGEVGFTNNAGQSFTFLVPLTGQANQLCLYEPTLHFPQYLTISQPVSTLHIKVTDDNNNVLSLSADWHFVISRV